MEAPALPFISLNLIDGARAAQDPLWSLAALHRWIHNNAIFRMLGEAVKLHAVGVVGKKYKGKMLVWGYFGPQPPGTRLASHPVWMARLNHPVLKAAFCRRESMSDVSKDCPMEDFWRSGVRLVLSSASADHCLLRFYEPHVSGDSKADASGFRPAVLETRFTSFSWPPCTS